MASFLKAKLSIYQTEEEIGKALLQLSVYTVFAIVVTVISLSGPSTQVFFFSESLDNQFLNIFNDEVDFKYDHIVTIDEWLNFSQNNFLNNLDGLLYKDNLLSIGQNYVLSVPKMRQIRVRKEKCITYPQLKTDFGDCYPCYSFGREETALYYKGTRYYKREEFPAVPHFGNAGTYNGPGYMKLLSFNKTENDLWFDEMKEIGWIDNGTRLLLIEIVVYNIDTLLFSTVKLSAELLPVGCIIPGWRIDMLPMSTIWSPNRPGVYFSSVIFYLLVLYYTSVEIEELLESGAKRYFSSAHNYIDLLLLATAFILFNLSMQRPFNMDVYLHKIKENPKALVSLDSLHFHYTTSVCVLGICVFLVWAKILRFIGFNKTMLQFRTTLKRCTKDIFGFALMFLIVFVAFALYGMLIFGSTRQDFHTFQNALFSMVRMVLGDFQYKNIEHTNRILCPLFYVFYVLFISFILLNMFLAIINNTYIYVKQEITEDKSALRTFFVNVYKRIKEKVTRPRRRSEPVSTLGKQEDTLSMYEFADVTFSNVASAKRDSIVNTLRRPFQKPYFFTDGRPSMEDSINEDLIRLSERLELLEDLLSQLQANMDRIFGRRKSRGTEPEPAPQQ